MANPISITSGDKAGRALCRIFGVDPDKAHIQRVSTNLNWVDGGDLHTATIDLIMTEEQCEALVKVLEKAEDFDVMTDADGVRHITL